MSDTIEIRSGGDVSISVGTKSNARVFVNGVALPQNQPDSAWFIYEAVLDKLRKTKLTGDDRKDAIDFLSKLEEEARKDEPNYKRVLRLAKSIEAILKAQE